MKLSVIKATLEDLDWMILELVEFSKTHPALMALDGDHEGARISLSILIEKHLCLICVDENGTRAGMIGGFVAPHFLNRNLIVLSELFWWVTPSFRSSRAGAMLLKYYTELGKTVAHQVTMTLEKESPVRPSSLEKRGYQYRESNYYLEVK